MKNLPNENYSTLRWIILSQLLLGLYLAFFHTALGKTPTEVVVIGLLFSAITTAIVVFFRKVFFNQFEYVIHLVLGVDILLEGFIPYHHTLGFYYCAAAFWTTFWAYHGFLLYLRKPSNVLAYQEMKVPAET